MPSIRIGLARLLATIDQLQLTVNCSFFDFSARFQGLFQNAVRLFLGIPPTKSDGIDRFQNPGKLTLSSSDLLFWFSLSSTLRLNRRFRTTGLFSSDVNSRSSSSRRSAADQSRETEVREKPCLHGFVSTNRYNVDAKLICKLTSELQDRRYYIRH